MCEHDNGIFTIISVNIPVIIEIVVGISRFWSVKCWVSHRPSFFVGITHNYCNNLALYFEEFTRNETHGENLTEMVTFSNATYIEICHKFDKNETHAKCTVVFICIYVRVCART